MPPTIPSPPDWEEIAARLRSEPGSTAAMGEALAGLRQPGEADRSLPLLGELADGFPHERHFFLLSDALHRLGRFEGADEALRLARRQGGDRGALNEFSKRHRPRVAERRRFYRCRSLCGMEGKRALELGGQLPPDFVRPAAPASWTSVSLAVSAEIAEPGYRAIRADAARLPLRDGSIDLVFSSSAFEHIGDLAGTLEEIGRVLAPGGALFSLFSPIWSSARGHHLKGPGREALRSAGLWPLAPWEHLTSTPEKMEARLAREMEPSDAARVTRLVYDRASLNRLFYEDYVHLLHASGLTVARIDLLEGKEPDPAILRQLQRLHPGRGSYHVAGLRVVLRREG